MTDVSVLRFDGPAARMAVVVITLIATVVVAGCDGPPEDVPGSEAPRPEAADAAPEPSTPAEQAPAAVDSDRGAPTLLDLGADKCVPCKMMAPVLEELRETYEGELSVVFIDVWKDRGAAREHGVSVIPTQIFLDADGNELFRHQGYYSREDILAKWNELGYTFEE